MSIKALFLPGQTDITVNGLHQWDYGQQLEIHADDLPALVEVHFACVGMDMAVVRSCAVTNGVGTVAIPDRCLEQAAPIMAWVYEVDGTVGMTTKTIVLNVMERARPSSPVDDIPPAVADKYTEAITAMNEVVADVDAKLDNAVEVVRSGVVEALSRGSVYVAEAHHAENADYAEEANFAQEAASATTANEAPFVEQRITNGLQDGSIVPARAAQADKARLLSLFVPATYSKLDDSNSYIELSLTRGYYYAELLPRDAASPLDRIILGMFYYNPTVGEKVTLVGCDTADCELLAMRIYVDSSGVGRASIHRVALQEGELGMITSQYKIRLTQISDNA